MHKFTITLQHVSYPHIVETFPAYASSIDDAYGIAYRAMGNWFQIVSVKSNTCTK
jgi:hypothetical protein